MKKVLEASSYLFVLFSAVLLLAASLIVTQKADQKQQKQSLSKIKLRDKWYVDENDRVILFHGINAVQKVFPWYPDSSKDSRTNDGCGNHCDMTNKTQLAYLKRWGFNVIRLGWMWAGLYPEKGYLNQTYANKMIEIIKDLQEYGMYVIIDMHQDMLSSLFESYDGAPLWILKEMPAPEHPYPWPFKHEGLFYGGAYFTEALSLAFENLYRNTNHFEDYFQEFWTNTAKILKDLPSVLAYELINEPWAGDIFKFPFYFLPGFAGRYNLMPLYDRVYEKIRSVDPETIVMYEPVTWGIMSNTSIFGTGFDHAPGKDPTKTALSWHYYCWIINIDNDPLRNGTLPSYIKGICDEWQLLLYFNTVQNDLRRYGAGASFISEFGGCSYFNPDTGRQVLEQCDIVMNGADEHFIPWTNWESNFYDEDFHIIPEFVNAFARVYPMATNGMPVSMGYNSTTKYFTYTFELNASSREQAQLDTEIFVPVDMYPRGFGVQVSDHLQWTYDSNSSRVLVTLKESLLDSLESVSTTSSVIIKSN